MRTAIIGAFALTACLTTSEEYQELLARSYDVDQDGHINADLGGDDCDDFDAEVFPGNVEVCDFKDNNCDGHADGDEAVDAMLLFMDGDGDGWGHPEAGVLTCIERIDFVENDQDCDDFNADNHPYADELCDGVDNDCDGLVDSDDADGPDAIEVWLDSDGDGYGDASSASVLSCAVEEGWVATGGDCDDSLASVSPGQPEVCSDGLDNDCDEEAEACRYDRSSLLGDLTWSHEGQEWDKVGLPNVGGDLDGDGAGDVLLGRFGTQGAYNSGVAVLAGPLGQESSRELAFIGPSEDHTYGTGHSQLIHPDINGDGVPDLVIGHLGGSRGGLGDRVDLTAPPTTAIELGNLFNDYGQLYVFYGPVVGDLSVDDADISLLTDSQLTVAMAGDTKGDGVQRLIVGVAYDDYRYSQGGVAWIIHEPWQGHKDIKTDYADPLWGVSSEDYAGWSVDGDADVNGDGKKDVLIGAPAAEPSGLDNSGAAYLVLGNIDGGQSLADADATFEGTVTDEFAGEAVAFAGDVDGDGYDDVLIGAPGDSADADVGVAYLVYGPANGNVRLSTAEAIFRGVDTGDRFGASLESVDLDSDGRSDLLIGAPSEGGDAGAVHIYYGPLSGNRTSRDADASLEGEPDSRLGWAMTAGSDLDGDGLPDAVLGAPTAGDNSGAAYLLPAFAP